MCACFSCLASSHLPESLSVDNMEGDTFQHRHAFSSGWQGVVWLEWTSGYHSQAHCRVFSNDNVHDSELNSE